MRFVGSIINLWRKLMEKIELIRDKNGYINIKFSNETSKLDEYEFVALIQDSIELLKSQLLSIEVES